MTAQNLVNTPDNRLVVAVDGPSGVGEVDAVPRRRKAFRGAVF